MAPGWHPYPMVRILGSLASGIFWGSYQDDGPSGLITFSLFIGLLFLGFRKLENKGVILFGAGWMIFLFLAGWFYVHFADPLNDPRHWRFALQEQNVEVEWSGQIKKTTISGSRLRAVVAMDSVSQDEIYPATEVNGDLLVYMSIDSTDERPYPGQYIHFKGKVMPVPPNLDPLGFDWKWYQRVRGVTHQLFLKSHSWTIPAGQGGSLRTYFHELREKFSIVLGKYLTEPEAFQLAKAIILGDREDMSDSLNEGYQASGSMHILAVSGLHVGLVAGMVMYILGLFLRKRSLQILKVGTAVLLIWIYIGLTGAEDSAIRAGVMFTIIILGRTISRASETLNLLAASVVFLLILNPWMIHYIGFQLSVLAVAGILFYHPLIFRMWYPGPWLKRVLWEPFCVTISAQLATLMLSLYCFHHFPVYFLLSGIFVVPLSSLFLATGLGLLVLDFILPIAGFIPGEILTWTALLMNALVLGIADLPGASLPDIYPSGFWSLVLPIVAGLFLYAIAKRHSSSFVLGSMLLAAGVFVQTLFWVQHKSTREWYILKRFTEPTTLLIKQGSNHVAIDFATEPDSTHRSEWPGYGRIWNVPASLDFKMGNIHQKDQLLHLGQDSLSWGAEISGNYHLLIDGTLPNKKPGNDVTVFIAPDLDWKTKRKLKEWGTRMEVPLSDLKEEGYFRKTFD